MKIRYNITGKDRKTLAAAVSEAIDKPVTYAGAPTFAYVVGKYVINREATLDGPDDRDLVEALAVQGYQPAEALYDAAPEAPAEPEAVDAPAEETPKRKGGIMDCLVEALNEDAGNGEKWERLHRQPTIIDSSGREHNLDGTFAAQTEYTEQPDLVTIELPLDGFNPEKLDNLCRMVYSKQTLLKMALGVDALPVRVLEDRIALPWFPYTEDAATIQAYSELAIAICRTAKEKQRVNAQPKEEYPNPRFTMRCWLISIGLSGPEFKLIRKLMTSTLPGNGAFSRGYDPRKIVQAEAAALTEAPTAEPTAEAEAAGEILPGEEEGADNE